MFWKRIKVGDRERVVVTRNGRFDRILEPGDYNLLAPPGTRLETETYRTDAVVFTSDWAPFLVEERPDVVERYFVVVKTGDTDIALVSVDGRLFQVLEPARRMLYWKGAAQVTAEVVNVIDEPEVPAEKLPALERAGASRQVVEAQVRDGSTGLLYLKNRFEQTLPPGRYGFWALAQPRVDCYDLRRQILEVPGQEILTRDKVTLRVNITAEYQVVDALLVAHVARDAAALLYRALQLAVRQTLGRRSLEEVLSERTDVDTSVLEETRRAVEAYGLMVYSIALKDVILPGEIREILNQVVTAEKQAQANLIRRREETAATRSLLNTARLMEDNPLLVRLKELETLERVVEKVDRVTVSDGFAGLMTKLVSLQ